MKKKAFKAALPYSLPICVGFLFMAMSYGILMRSKGFHALPELRSIAAVIALQKWKKNMLLSMAAGTVLYMMRCSGCLCENKRRLFSRRLLLFYAQIR